MGLLNRWSKKKEQEQLKAVRSSASDSEKKTDAKTVSAPQEAGMATPSGTSASDTVSAHEQSPKFRTVVLHPIISEKATLAESQGIYTFAVSNSATKIDVKFAIKQQYGILPKRVSMLCMEGKRLRFGRNRGKRSDWKKAVVSLPKGKTIHIHEGV